MRVRPDCEKVVGEAYAEWNGWSPTERLEPLARDNLKAIFARRFSDLLDELGVQQLSPPSTRAET